MRETWNGHYLDGRTAEAVDVEVTIERENLRIELPGALPSRWSYRSVRLTQGVHPGEHVRLELVDTQEAVVIPDRAFLDSVRRLAPGAALTRAARHAVPTSPERDSGRPRVHLWVAGTVGAVLVGYFWALPALAGLLADRVPVEWERDLGDAVADELAPADEVCDDPVLLDAVEGIVARLAGGLPDSRYDFRVSVADDSLVNAFAAPGGRIVVMRGLIDSSSTAEELAGVLAHEMQHVQLRHGTRALLRTLPLQAALSVVGGGGDGTAALVGTLGALRYARSDEAEADREGMRLLLSAGIDPEGMIAFFDTLQAKAGSTSPALTYFSTHPATEERRATLTELAAEATAPSSPIRLPVEWAVIAGRCRAPR
jgi:Zn-dependent protease with chaperone function